MKQRFLNIYFLLAATILPMGAIAQDAATASNIVVPFQNERYLLIGFNILLMIIITALGATVNATAQLKVARLREERRNKKNNVATAILLLIGIAATSTTAWAQDKAEATTDAAKAVVEPSIWSQLPNDIIIMIITAIIQFIIIIILARIQSSMLKNYDDLSLSIATEQKQSKWKKFFIKVNETVALEDEDKLDLHHDYDGIRELDNKVPSWWSWTWYGTILIGAIYLYRVFISGTMPTQIAELNQENEKAKAQNELFLKTAGNNVDEKTVKMLDQAGIDAGASTYTSMGCNACHGAKGEGGVGPNLTDEYWLHGGSINDVFHTIKYGVPDKGMKAWEADMSPMQIAQVSSYIESLKGSNPPGAKEPQGEKVIAATDATTATPTDTAAAK